MKRHEATVRITPEEFAIVNRLLEINSFEDMTESEMLEMGAERNRCEGIFEAVFDDGSLIRFDLCSGTSNYYDDTIWMNRDGSKAVFFDCSYELSNIEVEVNSEIYVVNIVKY